MTSRRRFTRGAFVGAVLAAGVALAPLRPWRVLVAMEPRTVAARLRRLLPDPLGARAIGAEYLRTHPGEATAAALVSAIAQSIPGGLGVLDRASDGALRALLAERTRSDFAEGKTVLLRRWILSKTEARLCALAAVRHEASGAAAGTGTFVDSTPLGRRHRLSAGGRGKE